VAVFFIKFSVNN